MGFSAAKKVSVGDRRFRHEMGLQTLECGESHRESNSVYGHKSTKRTKLSVELNGVNRWVLLAGWSDWQEDGSRNVSFLRRSSHELCIDPEKYQPTYCSIKRISNRQTSLFKMRIGRKKPSRPKGKHIAQPNAAEKLRRSPDSPNQSVVPDKDVSYNM